MGKNGQEKEKITSLESALVQIRKRYGEEAIMRLGDAPRGGVKAISTGSLALDLAIGVGGVPRGRVTEIFGPEGAGKTTLGLHIMAEAQREGGVAAFIDVEHAMDPIYAARCGVNVAELYLSQPDSAEQALEIIHSLIHSGAIDVVIVDSVAALVPQAELDGDMGESHVGLQARLMGQALRKLAGVVRESCASLVFTNQLRERIGVMFGNPETTPGGRALKHFASLRLDVRRGEQIKKGTQVIGTRIRVRVVKNKVAPPFQMVEFDVLFGEGIVKEADVLDTATVLGVVEKRGNHYLYKDIRLGHGRDAAFNFLRENSDLLRELRDAAKQARLTQALAVPVSVPGDRAPHRNGETVEETVK